MAFFTGIRCDDCGDEAAWIGVCNKKYIIMWARKNGWTVGKKCLCPQCKKRVKT